jgi:peptidoglycan pentaglycine glycine transferase (the first glycine)
MIYTKHLMQSDRWAAFRQSWGTTVVKAGNAYFTTHKIPFLPFKIGYMPRPLLEDIDWKEIKKAGEKEKCIFIKIEPNAKRINPTKKIILKKSERIFAYATFMINLQKSEEELLAAMDIKTRYNVNLAKRKGVEVRIGSSEKMVEEFLVLQHETSNRHGILLHPDEYYYKMVAGI